MEYIGALFLCKKELVNIVDWCGPVNASQGEPRFIFGVEIGDGEVNWSLLLLMHILLNFISEICEKEGSKTHIYIFESWMFHILFLKRLWNAEWKQPLMLFVLTYICMEFWVSHDWPGGLIGIKHQDWSDLWDRIVFAIYGL